MRASFFVVALTACAIVTTSVACGSSDSSGSDPGADDGGPSDPGKTPLGTTVEGGAGSDSGGGNDAGADGTVTVPPGSCGTAKPTTGFIPSLSVKVGSATRTYALTVPTGYTGTTLYPLVIGYHGDGGSGAGYRSSFPIEAQGGSEAIFAWPNGTNNNNGHSFDQLNDPPGNADVTFFDEMVAAIAAAYCINPARIYVHGMSGGAYFTNQLGRWRAPKIRAIGPQSGGGPFSTGNPADYDSTTGQLTVNGTVAALMIHGLADTDVPISEGYKSLAYWRMADGNTMGQAATSPSPCERQAGGTKTVTFCAIPDLQHVIWSGAPAAIWQFFVAN